MGQSYLVTCSTTSPYINVFPFSSSGYGTRFSNPATLPAGGAIVAAPRFSPYGNAIVLAHTTTPRVTGYPFSSSGFGTKYTDPATLPGTIGTGTSFISATEIAVTSIGTPSSMTFGFSSSTGWGSRNIGSPTSTAGGTAVSARSNVAFFAYQNTPFIGMYPCTNPGLGTRYTAVSPTPTTTPSFGYGSHVSGSANDVALVLAGAATYNVWPWTVGSGFGTRYTTSAPSGFSSGSGLKFSAAGDYLAIGDTSGNLAVLPWTSGTGPGTRWAAPASPPTGNLNSSVFLNSDFFVGGSSPYLYGYPWTSSGFGTRYANPVGITGSAVQGIDAVFVPANVLMTASAGTFALTGVAANLKSTRTITATAQSFSLTGIASALRSTRTIAASYGTYGLTGIAARLVTTRTISAATTSFALTGQSAGLQFGHKVTASLASFALTGVSATLVSWRRTACATGSFTLTGIANRLATIRTITVSASTFSLTGYDVNLVATTASRTIFAATRHFTLTGISSILSKGSKVLASVGTFTVGTRSAGLASTRIIVSGPSTFSLSGQPSTLTFARKLSISSRQFVVSGIASNLFRIRSLYATSRQFLLTGNTAYLKTIHPPIICQAGAFTLPVLATKIQYSNFKVTQFPPHLEFNSTGKNVNLKPIKAIVGTMLFTVNQTACALRSHKTDPIQSISSLKFNLNGKDVRLKPSRTVVGTMSFAMEQTACALRWHRI